MKEFKEVISNIHKSFYEYMEIRKEKIENIFEKIKGKGLPLVPDGAENPLEYILIMDRNNKFYITDRFFNPETLYCVEIISISKDVRHKKIELHNVLKIEISNINNDKGIVIDFREQQAYSNDNSHINIIDIIKIFEFIINKFDNFKKGR